MTIKRVQIEDQEVNILNAYEDKPIFLLRDINYHTRIQTILKLFEKVSSSKIHISRAGAYKNRIEPGKMVWSQLSIKILGVHFATQNQLRYQNILLNG